uniref:OMP_b-brl domain-containing protein n=1 Tax=Rhabditophanes sp. KR3021 TaxID=114890 RepID=A0AC35TS68_9BILA
MVEARFFGLKGKLWYSPKAAYALKRVYIISSENLLNLSMGAVSSVFVNNSKTRQVKRVGQHLRDVTNAQKLDCKMTRPNVLNIINLGSSVKRANSNLILQYHWSAILKKGMFRRNPLHTLQVGIAWQI